MKYWSRYPVFRFLIPFGAGILFSIFNPTEITAFVIVALIFLVISAWFTVKNLATGKYAHRWLAGIPFYLLFFSLGGTLTWLSLSTNHTQHFKTSLSPTTLIAHAHTELRKTGNGWKFIADVKAAGDSVSLTSCRGKILVSLKTSDTIPPLNPGDLFVMRSSAIINIPKPTNPEAFDYAFFMSMKGITHRCFIDQSKFMVLKKGDQTSIRNYAIGVRDYFLVVLKKYITGPGELGVAGALLLGYEEWLDPEIENQYAVSGVLHILCVSGMHVGLMFVIFSWLFGWMEKKKSLRNFKFILLIVLIWFYSLVTGFAPSIIRAATMFTFVIVGQWLRKPAGIYNSLCSSCLFMFIFDPFMIMAPGFQLSFLAVLGIVVLQKPMMNQILTSNRVTHHIWELITISIAAQIATSPLSIFLFNQFPNYFLLGNLIVVPLTTLAMYIGLVLFAVDLIPFAGMVVGQVLSSLIWLVNALVAFFGSLPGATTEGIHLLLSEMFLLYLLIIFVFAWLMRKSFSYLGVSLILLTIILGSRVYTTNENQKVQLLTVYETRGSTMISLIQGALAHIISDTSYSEKNFRFVAQSHLTAVQADKDSVILMESGKYLSFDQERVLILQGISRNDSLAVYDTDILILGGKLTRESEQIIMRLNPKLVVFDGSLRYFKIDELTKTLTDYGIKVHNVRKQGAIEIKLPLNRQFHSEEKHLSSSHPVQ